MNTRFSVARCCCELPSDCSPAWSAYPTGMEVHFQGVDPLQGSVTSYWIPSTQILVPWQCRGGPYPEYNVLSTDTGQRFDGFIPWSTFSGIGVSGQVVIDADHGFITTSRIRHGTNSFIEPQTLMLNRLTVGVSIGQLCFPNHQEVYFSASATYESDIWLGVVSIRVHIARLANLSFICRRETSAGDRLRTLLSEPIPSWDSSYTPQQFNSYPLIPNFNTTPPNILPSSVAVRIANSFNPGLVLTYPTPEAYTYAFNEYLPEMLGSGFPFTQYRGASIHAGETFFAGSSGLFFLFQASTFHSAAVPRWCDEQVQYQSSVDVLRVG